MLHEVFPAVHDAQSAWMSSIDSLQAPDRKTHELIRLACTVILRNGPGVARHAKFAAEFGATWAGSIASRRSLASRASSNGRDDAPISTSTSLLRP
jgi:hypothetical protein